MPQFFIKNFDTLGIPVLEPGREINFFNSLAGLRKLIEEQDQTVERGVCIPAYDNVLKDWVPKFAMGYLPSENAPLKLQKDVRILFHMYLHWLTAST